MPFAIKWQQEWVGVEGSVSGPQLCLAISKSMSTKDIHIVAFCRMYNVLLVNIADIYSASKFVGI